MDGVKNSLGQLLERIMRRTSEHLSPFFILNEHGKRMSWPMLRNRWADAREAARVKAEVEKSQTSPTESPSFSSAISDRRLPRKSTT